MSYREVIEATKASRIVIAMPMLRTALAVFAIVTGVLLLCLATLDWLAYDQFLLTLSIQ